MYDVWSQFSLHILYSIADHSTARSGASTQVACKNLLQQLSVSLWLNNAKMILIYWALQCGDTDFPAPSFVIIV